MCSVGLGVSTITVFTIELAKAGGRLVRRGTLNTTRVAERAAFCLPDACTEFGVAQQISARPDDNPLRSLRAPPNLRLGCPAAIALDRPRYKDHSPERWLPRGQRTMKKALCADRLAVGPRKNILQRRVLAAEAGA